ncbi:MAG TPA: hypothetical protein ENJ45_01950 [Phaeodactylibacter sp.]|nr:hypothetical protein [Phaeodactylibacter sp.]
MTNAIKVFFFIGLCALLGSSLSACRADIPKLNRQDKKIIDSIYIAQRKVLLIELDSICDVFFEQRVKVAVDSILIIRRKEIQRLKNN